MFAVASPTAAAGAPSLAPRVSGPRGHRVSGSSPMTSAVPRSTRFRTARRAVTDTATAPEDESPAVDAAPSAPAFATDDDAPPSTRAGASASSSSASPPAAGENTFVQSIARQGRGETDGVTLDDLLAAKTGGPPRFFMRGARASWHAGESAS